MPEKEKKARPQHPRAAKKEPKADPDAPAGQAVEELRDDSAEAKAVRIHALTVQSALEKAVVRCDQLARNAVSSPLGAGPESLEQLAEELEELSSKARANAAVLRSGSVEANPILLVSRSNIRSQLYAALSELDAAVNTPKAWDGAERRFNECLKVTKAATVLMGQNGMSSALVRPGEPLRTADGQELVEA